MEHALWITLIGMGLVFIAILALWGLMALLVKVTAGLERQVDGPAPAGEALPALEAHLPEETLALKRRAAAAAVAVALALTSRPIDARDTNTVSAWQLVQRAAQLEQRSTVSRKKVIR